MDMSTNRKIIFIDSHLCMAVSKVRGVLKSATFALFGARKFSLDCTHWVWWVWIEAADFRPFNGCGIDWVYPNDINGAFYRKIEHRAWRRADYCSILAGSKPSSSEATISKDKTFVVLYRYDVFGFNVDRIDVYLVRTDCKVAKGAV